MAWKRVRMLVEDEDPRPVTWPPPGPFWISGTNQRGSWVIAYLKDESQVEEFWPGSEVNFVQEVEEITYTDRFAKPEWYLGD